MSVTPESPGPNCVFSYISAIPEMSFKFGSISPLSPSPIQMAKSSSSVPSLGTDAPSSQQNQSQSENVNDSDIASCSSKRKSDVSDIFKSLSEMSKVAKKMPLVEIQSKLSANDNIQPNIQLTSQADGNLDNIPDENRPNKPQGISFIKPKCSMSLAELARSQSSQPSVAVALKDQTCSLASIAKTHHHSSSDQTQQMKQVSLSSLAKVHANKGSESSIAETSLSVKTQKLSLAELAKSHSDQHSSSQPSLSDQANLHSAASPGHTQGTQSMNQSPSGISLAALSYQSKSTGSSPVSLSKPATTTKTGGISLAELAKAHSMNKQSVDEEKKTVSNEAASTTGSLLRPEVMKNKDDVSQKMLSLSSLIQKQSKGTGDQRDVEIGAQSSASSGQASISLRDLVKDKSAKSNSNKDEGVGTKILDKVNKTDSIVYETQDDEDISMLTSSFGDTCTMDIFEESQIQFISSMVTRPSVIANTLFHHLMKSTNKDAKVKYKHKKFKFQYQVKGQALKATDVYHEIKAFDFSTPSPDDLVKERQRQAFTRTGPAFTQT